jgi:hypothetical protein
MAKGKTEAGTQVPCKREAGGKHLYYVYIWRKKQIAKKEKSYSFGRRF